MKKYLEYLNGKSQKFFKIIVIGNVILTIEGKLGKKGKVEEERCASDELALSVAERLWTEKLQEGYVEGDENNPTLPELKEGNAKTNPKTKTEEWHKNNYWHYGTYDSKALTDLTKATERKKKPSRGRYDEAEEALLPYNNTSPDWDENFPKERETLQYKFEKACRIQNIEWIEKYLKEGANLNSTVGFKELSTLAAIVDDYDFGEGDTIETIKYLIKKGVDYKDRSIDKTITSKSAAIIGKCISAFRENPDITKIDALFDSILQPIWDELADSIIAYIRSMLNSYPKQGEKYYEMRIKNYVYGDKVLLYFINSVGDEVKINEGTGEAFELTTKLPIKGLSSTCGVNNLFYRLEKPLQKIKDEGLFDVISKSEFVVGMEDAYENIHPFFTIVNEEKRIVEKKNFEENLHKLETKEEWEPWADGEEVAYILLNGKGITEPDEKRALRLLKDMLFSTNRNEHLKVWHTFLASSNKPYEGEAFYQLVVYIIENKGYLDEWGLERLEMSAKLGYDPAIRLLTEINEKKSSPIDKNIISLSKRFTPQELFLDNDLLTIRASENEGYIRLAFKAESEEAYSIALDFINNLLCKEYAYHFKGYQLLVKFVEEPTLGIPSFPNTPVNAFFGKAVSYINLRPKIEEYAVLAFKKGGQYLEINSSAVNTVVGSFAAGALALVDLKYLYLIDEYVSQVDGEHECIQLELIDELKEVYGGITPDMVPTIVDLATSYDQPGYYGIPEELYTNPLNLKAISNHLLTSPKYARARGNSLVKFVETRLLYKTPKNNLRKIAELASRANTDAEKLIYIRFYNTYKNFAEQYHNESYGEDLGLQSQVKDFFTGYTETSPVVISIPEALEKGYKINQDKNNKAHKNTFIYFHPVCFRNPRIKLLLDRQWEKAKTSKYIDLVNFDESILYENWYINIDAMPCEYGVVHLQESKKPIVYYGGLDVVALAHATATKPPKDEKTRLKIQDKYSVMEVPSVITDRDKRRRTLLCNLFEARYNFSNYQIQRVAELMTPDDGDYYATALMYGIEVAVAKGDIQRAKEYSIALAKATPEYKDYWLQRAKQYL